MGLLPSYNVKDIIDLIKKGSEIEAQEKILELKEAALKLQEENISLKEKIKRLKEELELKESIEWDGSVYWLTEKDSDKKEGPFCQICFDGDKKLIRLQKEPDPLGGLPRGADRGGRPRVGAGLSRSDCPATGPTGVSAAGVLLRSGEAAE